MSSELIKKLRELTGAGMLDVKEALEKNNWDEEAAIKYLREIGAAKLVKKAERAASEGVVESYIHAGGKIGVLVEVNCETDFVGRTDDFKALAKDIALHIAASAPLYVSREDVPASALETEKEILTKQAEGKPADVVEKMVSGRIEKYYEETCLLDQAFVKDTSKTVNDLISEAVSKLGENIKVSRFSRFVLGN